MTTFGSVDAILDFAIKNEQEAQKFYAGIAANTTRSGSKALFESFVEEERRHEEKLKSVKDGQAMEPMKGNVADLKSATMWWMLLWSPTWISKKPLFWP